MSARDVFEIRIAYEDRERRPEGRPAAQSGEELDAIRFDLHASAAPVAALARAQGRVDLRHVEGEMRRQPVQDADECGARAIRRRSGNGTSPRAFGVRRRKSGPGASRAGGANKTAMTRVRVDAVMLEARAAMLAKRSIKASSKRAGIDLAIACMDLTTLEGRDTPAKVRGLCARGIAPGARRPRAWRRSACTRISSRPRRKHSRIRAFKVASVATAFPERPVPTPDEIARNGRCGRGRCR